MSMSSYLSSSSTLMSAILDRSLSCSWMVFMPTSLMLGFTIDWPGFFYGEIARIIISDRESCCAATKTSAEGSGTHVVEVYSIASWSQSYDFFKSPRKVTPLSFPTS
jgi:hypothetical protein